MVRSRSQSLLPLDPPGPFLSDFSFRSHYLALCQSSPVEYLSVEHRFLGMGLLVGLHLGCSYSFIEPRTRFWLIHLQLGRDVCSEQPRFLYMAGHNRFTVLLGLPLAPRQGLLMYILNSNAVLQPYSRSLAPLQ